MPVDGGEDRDVPGVRGLVSVDAYRVGKVVGITSKSEKCKGYKNSERKYIHNAHKILDSLDVCPPDAEVARRLACKRRWFRGVRIDHSWKVAYYMSNRSKARDHVVVNFRPRLQNRISSPRS